LPAQETVEELNRQLASARGEQRVDLLNRLARATQANAPSVALGHAERALELAERIGNDRGRVQALNNIGIGFYHLSRYGEALDAYERSLAAAESLGDDTLIANVLNNIGVIHYIWGDTDRTLEYYARVLDIRNRMNDSHGLGVAYNNLGNVYYTVGRHQESLEYYNQALPFYEETGDRSRFASTLNNIGLVYYRMERYNDALDQFERALEIEEGIQDRSGLALTLNNLGMVQDKLGRLGKALAQYRRALAVREELGDRQGIAVCLQNIGRALAESGDYDQGLEHLQHALESARELGVKEIERDVLLTLSKTYERMGDHQSALGAFVQHKEVADSLFGEETGSLLAELKARYELAAKDQEIEILRKNQEFQRVTRNMTLAGSVLLLAMIGLIYNRFRLKAQADREMFKAAEAERVAQAERERAARAELAHVSRVGVLGELSGVLAHELNQPVTAILSNAQATRRGLAARTTNAGEVEEALDDIVAGAGRAREILKRLRQMLRRGEIQRIRVDLNRALQDVERILQASASQYGASLVLELAPDLPAVEGDPIQLQQVVLNLVLNAAEAMGGEGDAPLIVRTVAHGAREIRIEVVDAGPELEDEKLARIFDPFFTTKASGLGMGLPLCVSVVEDLGGRIEAVRNPDRGLTVRITLPAADFARRDRVVDGTKGR
jgi:signal transduction histidine kinase/Tfp pilus assembly protein PilF